MQEDEVERIRLLGNRMRQPTNRAPVPANDESLKSIKSTNSKRQIKDGINHLDKSIDEERDQAEVVSPQAVKVEPTVQSNLSRQEKAEEQLERPAGKKSSKTEELAVEGETHNLEKSFIQQPETKCPRKITDYYTARPSALTTSPRVETKVNPDAAPVREMRGTPHDGMRNEADALRDENTILRQKLKLKDDTLCRFKERLLVSVMELHRMQREDLKARVAANRHRLGQYTVDRKGKEAWFDGFEIRKSKTKLHSTQCEKEDLQRVKKSNKRAYKDSFEDNQEWKNFINCYGYFLNREESFQEEQIKALDQQRAAHIKQYKLLVEQENSRYYQVDPASGEVRWPRIGKYQLMGLLGKGGFSEVYKGYNVQELHEVAIKLHYFNPSWTPEAKENYVIHALREKEVHSTLNHPNIVKLYDTVEVDKYSFCTVLEYCEGPQLSAYLRKHKRIPEKQAKTIIRQVISAVNYLHNLPEKVIHYDLKPQNILFHRGRIKITDFGLCKTLKEEQIRLTSQGVGTYWYLAPECFVTETRPVITLKVDVWAIGCIYFELLYGQKPFGNEMSQMHILNESIIRKATVVNFPNTLKNQVSPQSKDFIRDCLTFNVEERKDISSLLNHRLFERKEGQRQAEFKGPTIKPLQLKQPVESIDVL